MSSFPSMLLLCSVCAAGPEGFQALAGSHCCLHAGAEQHQPHGWCFRPPNKSQGGWGGLAGCLGWEEKLFCAESFVFFFFVWIHRRAPKRKMLSGWRMPWVHFSPYLSLAPESFGQNRPNSINSSTKLVANQHIMLKDTTKVYQETDNSCIVAGKLKFWG